MKAVLLLTPDENFFVHIHMLFQSVCCASLSDATYVREVLSVYLYSTRTAQQAKVIDLYCPSLPVAAAEAAAVAKARRLHNTLRYNYRPHGGCTH